MCPRLAQGGRAHSGSRIATEFHGARAVVFNNNARDYALRNAAQFRELLQRAAQRGDGR